MWIWVSSPTAFPHHLFPKPFPFHSGQYRTRHCNAPSALSWIWTIPGQLYLVLSYLLIKKQAVSVYWLWHWLTKQNRLSLCSSSLIGSTSLGCLPIQTECSQNIPTFICLEMCHFWQTEKQWLTDSKCIRRKQGIRYTRNWIWSASFAHKIILDPSSNLTLKIKTYFKLK